MPKGFWLVYGGTATVMAGSWALALFIDWLNNVIAAAQGVKPSDSHAYVFLGVLAVFLAALTYGLMRFLERTD